MIEFKAKSDTGLLLVEVPNCDEIGTVPVLRRLTGIKYTEGNRCDKLRA
jgi:hypothetical protein